MKMMTVMGPWTEVIKREWKKHRLWVEGKHVHVVLKWQVNSSGFHSKSSGSHWRFMRGRVINIVRHGFRKNLERKQDKMLKQEAGKFISML